MSAASLIEELRARGVRLRAVGSELRFLPRDLDADVLASMRQHKEGLLTILRVQQAVAAQASSAAATPRPEFGITPSALQLRSLRITDDTLQRMLAKHDAADLHLAAVSRRGCQACGRDDWYESSHPAQRVCRHCHPPYGTPRPAPVVAAAPVTPPTPPTAPGAWTCPRGHGSDPSHWRRWGCGACRLQAEVVS